MAFLEGCFARLEDGKWDEVRTDGRSRKDAALAGTTAEAVWITEGTKLIALNAAGDVATRAMKADLGLAPLSASRFGLLVGMIALAIGGWSSRPE